MPSSLDETYERMLCDISDESFQEARRLLTLLCFSPKPLTTWQLIEAIAVSLQDPTGFDRKRRVQDVDDLCKICPGLIDVILDENREEQIRIAHFSVQEYLESDRIKQSAAAHFHLQASSAHQEIAESYLRYLQDAELCDIIINGDADESTTLREFPLAQVAARDWLYHFRTTSHTHTTALLDRLVFRLLHDCQDWLLVCLKLWDYDVGP